MVDILYPCNPNKNVACNKRGCFINGGPCRSTTHAEYCDTGDLISREALLYALDDTALTDDGGVDINELEDLIKRMPTIEAEPTFEQIEEYCRKRCLVVVDGALFNEMKSRWSAEPNSCEYWDSESRFCALRRPQAVSEKSYEQGAKDALNKYDEACRTASYISVAMGCKTSKDCWELIRNNEIQRVKHGKWEKKGISIKGIEKEFCSECKTWSYGRNKAYCPNCGAKMDLDKVEE